MSFEDLENIKGEGNENLGGGVENKKEEPSEREPYSPAIKSSENFSKEATEESRKSEVGIEFTEDAIKKLKAKKEKIEDELEGNLENKYLKDRLEKTEELIEKNETELMERKQRTYLKRPRSFKSENFSKEATEKLREEENFMDKFENGEDVYNLLNEISKSLKKDEEREDARGVVDMIWELTTKEDRGKLVDTMVDFAIEKNLSKDEIRGFSMLIESSEHIGKMSTYKWLHEEGEPAIIGETEGETPAVEVEEEPAAEPVEGEGEPESAAEPTEPTEPAEPTETEAGQSWEEIGKRAGGAEEVIKGMEAKVFEKMEGVEENPDIPKHEKEKAVFSLGIKENKLDAVRLTTEMAQLKAEEFKLKEGIKGIELKLKEGGLDEAKEGELQEELKGLEIERHRIIRETTRLAIEKRNGLESLKLSIEAAVADQNLKISKWEKGAGEKKEGFISGLAGAIKHKTEEARAALAESYKRINKESENDMINDVKGASSFNELKSVIDNLKTADTKEEAQNFLSEFYNRLDSLENSVDLDKELDEMRKDLNSRKGILKLKLKKLTTSERKVFESLLDRVKVLAEGGEDGGGETPGEIPLPPPPVSEIPGGGAGEGSEEGAGEREQLGNEKKEEIKRILNGLEPEKIEILKQAFGNAIDAGYADWKVAALFRGGSDINDIIIKDNSEVLEEVAVGQLMEVIEEYSEEEFGGGEVLEEAGEDKTSEEEENEKELGDEKKEEIKGKDEVGFEEFFKGMAGGMSESMIKKAAEDDARIRGAIKDNNESAQKKLKEDFYNFFEEPWTEDFNPADFRKNYEIKNNLRKIFEEKFNGNDLMDIWKIIENESEEDEVEKVITDKTAFEKATKGEVDFDEIKKLKVRELKYIIGIKINEKTGEIDKKETGELSDKDNEEITEEEKETFEMTGEMKSAIRKRLKEVIDEKDIKTLRLRMDAFLSDDNVYKSVGLNSPFFMHNYPKTSEDIDNFLNNSGIEYDDVENVSVGEFVKEFKKIYDEVEKEK